MAQVFAVRVQEAETTLLALLVKVPGVPEGNFCSLLFGFSRLPAVLGDPSSVLENGCDIHLRLASSGLWSPFYEDLDDNEIVFRDQRRQGDLFSSKSFAT